MNKLLSLEGHTVYSVGVFGHHDNMPGAMWERKKVVLDEVHKRKIDNSDAILVLDVGGYIGSSTRAEINYAAENKKEIFYLTNMLDVI